ncbi:DUF2185 domain-containing protein [Anaerolineales bacterium HSG24]|nr:DUF2185 domain-containing protein [Anaerolineales bacterium HSG24]
MARETWWLDDAQQIANENPYTFYKPSPSAVAALGLGNMVKLIFRFPTLGGNTPTGERMWVEITKIGDNSYEGTLANQPYYMKGLEHGDKINFEPKHIIALDVDDRQASDHDRYFKRCFVTNRILCEGAKAKYIYKEAPDQEDDSGWRIVEGDEPDEYLQNSDNISYVAIGVILNQDNSFIHLLDVKPNCWYIWEEYHKMWVKGVNIEQ